MFAGVTAMVSNKRPRMPRAEYLTGASNSTPAAPPRARDGAGADEFRLAVHATWNAGAVGTGQRPQVPRGGVIARRRQQQAAGGDVEVCGNQLPRVRPDSLRRPPRHRCDAARWRAIVALERARTGTIHPTHWLIST